MATPPYDLGRARLGELLVQRGIPSTTQLDQALEEQKRSGLFLGAILVSKGWASEVQVAKALSEQLGLAYVDLAARPVESDTLALIPADLCRTHHVVPLYVLGDSMTVAMGNPLDATAIGELQRVAQRHIRPVFATPSAIRKILEQKLPTAGATPTPAADQPAAAKEGASLAPVIQLVDTLVTDAINSLASDIHLEPSEERFACRFRVDGILHDRPPLPKEYQAAVISRIKIMANMDIAEKRLPQDGRIQTLAGGGTIDLRVSTFPTIHGENVVIRILDKARVLLKLEELGFSELMFNQFSGLIAKPHGIILVTGPTGSGKTTTLYSVLNRLNKSDKNIMTLEDPVECELPRIRQSQVNVKAGLTFAMGLRSMVRQDPDIILIGEIRDKETADIAIHASLTGHLVFSTLHTNDAASASTRLVDMGVEPFLVATSLIGVLAQRLVRTLCPECRRPIQPAPEVLARIGVKPGTVSTIYEEVGCAKCRQTGYQGRLGVFELLIPNERIRQLIAQRVQAGEVKEEAVSHGMVTLHQDGIDKLVRGITSMSEILRVTEEE